MLATNQVPFHSTYPRTPSQMNNNLQMLRLFLLSLLLLLLSQLVCVSSLIDEDDGAQDGYLSTDSQERPESSVLVCTHTHLLYRIQ